MEKQVQSEERIRNLVEQIVESVSTVGYSGETEQLKEKFKKLKTVHELQKSIVRQKIHNVMSPLSAISGYIELLNISLMNDPDVGQIDFYRQKIEKGITEVNTIVEQLQGIYTDESDTVTEDFDSTLVVEFNWLVEEVLSKMNFTELQIEFEKKSVMLHVKTDIFITKLIVFNLINYATKCNSSKHPVQLLTYKENKCANFALIFEAAKIKKIEINRVVKSALAPNNSFVSNNTFDDGLITSVKLAQQIRGEIAYADEGDGLAILKLSIPLAN